MGLGFPVHRWYPSLTLREGFGNVRIPCLNLMKLEKVVLKRTYDIFSFEHPSI
jgi:hypothetical protein